MPVGASGAVPRSLGLNRAALTAARLRGQARPNAGRAVGHRPDAHRRRDRRRPPRPSAGLRNAAAALVRAAGKRTVDRHHARRPRRRRRGDGRTGGRRGRAAGRVPLPRPEDRAGAGRVAGADAGRRRAAAPPAPGSAPTAARPPPTAAGLARDLANTPPAHLTARMIAERAVELGAASGLGVEVFNKDQLTAMGLRRHDRRQQGQHRAAADGPAHVHAAQPAWSPGDRRQGRHVRLRRHQPEAQRRACTR